MMELIDELAINGHRITEFTLSSDTFDREIQRKLQFSVPNLEFLRLKPDDKDSGSIQPSLFGGQIPNLKCLDLTGIYSWPSGLFNNLKEITLYPTQFRLVKESCFLICSGKAQGCTR